MRSECAKPSRRRTKPELRHLAVVSRRFAPLLVAGRKQIESRLLQTRKPPLGCVRQGDGIGFKISGGEVIGVWRATWVREYHDLRPTDVDALRREFNRWICAPASYWRERRRSRYAVLIGIEPANLPRIRVTPPRLFGTAWVQILGGSTRRNGRA